MRAMGCWHLSCKGSWLSYAYPYFKDIHYNEFQLIITPVTAESGKDISLYYWVSTWNYILKLGIKFETKIMKCSCLEHYKRHQNDTPYAMHVVVEKIKLSIKAFWVLHIALL